MYGLGHTLHKPWEVLKQEQESIARRGQRVDKVTKPQLSLTAFLFLTSNFNHLQVLAADPARLIGLFITTTLI